MVEVNRTRDRVIEGLICLADDYDVVQDDEAVRILMAAASLLMAAREQEEEGE